MIDSDTQLCCIIGDPIGHSLSPRMQNAAFAAKNLNFAYLAFPVRKENLVNAIQGLRTLGARGFNVTIPHKVAVTSLLDEMDESARAVGAVNTVMRNGQTLVGFNTDIEGFLAPLRSRGVSLQGSRVSILGSGGAARAVVQGLVQEGSANVTVFGRTGASIQAFSRVFEQTGGTRVQARLLSAKGVQDAVARSDILVNATPVGMGPDASESLVGRDILRRHLLVYDLVYTPVKTPLIRLAEEMGASTIKGYEMLVAQGMAAFKLWTNLDPPAEVMKKAVLEALEERS